MGLTDRDRLSIELYSHIVSHIVSHTALMIHLRPQSSPSRRFLFKPSSRTVSSWDLNTSTKEITWSMPRCNLHGSGHPEVPHPSHCCKAAERFQKISVPWINHGSTMDLPMNHQESIENSINIEHKKGQFQWSKTLISIHIPIHIHQLHSAAVNCSRSVEAMAQ